MKNTAYFVILLAACLLVAAVSSFIVRIIVEPEVDRDAMAYLELVQAAQEFEFSKIEYHSTQARSLATDPDLRRLADFMARQARNALSMGVTTVDEGNSWSGFGKGFLIGLINPGVGLDSLLIELEGYLGNFEEIGNRVDNRYAPVFEQVAFAHNLSRIVFWLVFVGGIITGTCLRHRIIKSSNKSRPILNPGQKADSPSTMQRFLLVGDGLNFELKTQDFINNGGQLIIGRKAQLAHLVVHNDSISRQHATLTLLDNRLHIADRNSGNGTKVNNREIPADHPGTALNPGDRISLGEVDLVLDAKPNG